MEEVKLTPQQAMALKLQKLIADSMPKTEPENVGNGWYLINRLPGAVSFQKEVSDGVLLAILELRHPKRDNDMFPKGRIHISVSHNSHLRGHNETIGECNIAKRIPSWDELKEVRQMFAPPDVNMAIMFPPPEKYVNIHASCIHLLQIPVELALDPGPLGAI